MLGGVAAGLLGACGASQASPTPQLVALFSPDHVIAAGIRQRVPFAVVDLGDLTIDDDAELPVRVLLDGEVIDSTSVVGRVVEHGHVDPEAEPDHQHADLLRYFALRTMLPEPGVYDIEVDFGPDAGSGRLPVQAFDPSEVPVVVPGAKLPAISTPTISNPEGISPLCTRAPEACPFHEHDVADVLAEGRPLALLVATPALCLTAYCGPVVETMIDVAPDFGDVSFVHLEVYANASEVGGNYDDPAIELAKPVTDLGLAFEPSLILVNASGTIIDRIDNIYDRDELSTALSTLQAG